MGIQMAAIIAVGTFVGVTLDEKHPNENNLFTLILTLFSVVLSVYYVIKRIISVSKKQK
ncbi:AtpZ/AtpI family protein [Flavobacteriaceae bacterium]|nr:AtpZ/AtpI family protein [Flavobacteriaceae bacterium]MDC1195128.1 AtpZ/AtpI family protein [Flavobacteriaceae bacterium]MDC1259588.1 AtpZ/AtpI family protein [Flavobacteriaceae bacterium]